MSDATLQQPLFSIDKVYVKDLSLEIPHAPGIFMERATPQISLQLHSQATPMEEGLFEVTITVTVTARIEEKDQVMFLLEVKQAGIFQLRNIPQKELGPLLGIACPNILYPFLREAVSDLTVRAGFAPVLLDPVSFDTLYNQQRKAEAASVTKH